MSARDAPARPTMQKEFNARANDSEIPAGRGSRSVSAMTGPIIRAVPFIPTTGG